MANQSRRARYLRRLDGSLIMAMLTRPDACAARPHMAYDVRHPSTAPVRNIANFNEALCCKDDLFIAHGRQDIHIITAGISDATGLIAADIKKLSITTASRISTRSNAVHFVNFDPTQRHAQVLSEMAGLSLSASLDKSEGFHQAMAHDSEPLLVHSPGRGRARFQQVPGVRMLTQECSWG